MWHLTPAQKKTASAHLVDIFKAQATAAETPVDSQRVLRDEAQCQRVATEASDDKNDVWINPDDPRLAEGNVGTSSPLFAEYPTTTAEKTNCANVISQGDDNAESTTGMTTR